MKSIVNIYNYINSSDHPEFIHHPTAGADNVENINLVNILHQVPL